MYPSQPFPRTGHYRSQTHVYRNSPDAILTVQVSATAATCLSRRWLSSATELVREIAAPAWIGHHCAQSQIELTNSANRSMTTGASISVRHPRDCSESTVRVSGLCDAKEWRRPTSRRHGVRDVGWRSSGRAGARYLPPSTWRMGVPLDASRLPFGSLRSAIDPPAGSRRTAAARRGQDSLGPVRASGRATTKTTAAARPDQPNGKGGGS